MSVIPSQFELLGNLLDAASLRHQVIANNVANVNTPGYKRLDVDFEDALSRELALHGDSVGHRLEPRVIEGVGDAEREDGNNVGIDREMTRMHKNSLLYGVYSQVLATRLAAMRSAISGR